MEQKKEDIWLQTAAVEAYKSAFNDIRHFTVEIFKSGVQYGKEDVVSRACDWFYAQLNDGSVRCDDIQKFIKKFKKKMEE